MLTIGNGEDYFRVYNRDEISDEEKSIQGWYKCIVNCMAMQCIANIGIYIHIALPVLNETRSVVIIYSNMFKEFFSGLANVYFMDVVFDLLDESECPQDTSAGKMKGTKYTLKTKYVSDGTHNHSRYLEHVLGALRRMSK